MQCKSISRLFFFVLLSLSVTACYEEELNLNKAGEDVFQAQSIERIPTGIPYYDTTYVSIYSDIYSETKHTRFNLTATLSLRNTSFSDTIYIADVDYYDSAGDKIRSYLEKPIMLEPMQSMEYVIEEQDTAGGTGANFIVNWAATSSEANPLFEGIMISTNGQQGISFSTQGISISKRK